MLSILLAINYNYSMRNGDGAAVAMAAAGCSNWLLNVPTTSRYFYQLDPTSIINLGIFNA